MIAKVISSLHDLHRRYLSIFFFSYCFSRSRTLLFCFSSNFSDFNETQTKSKNFLLALYKTSQSIHLLISIMHSFVLFLTEFFKFWRDIDKNEKSSIIFIYLSIEHVVIVLIITILIVVVIVATIKLVSIRKWLRIYKQFLDFLFFFLSHRRSQNDFSECD